MCLGSWSRLGLIHAEDINAVTRLSQVPKKLGDEDGDILMPAGFDSMGSDDETDAPMDLTGDD